MNDKIKQKFETNSLIKRYQKCEFEAEKYPSKKIRDNKGKKISASVLKDQIHNDYLKELNKLKKAMKPYIERRMNTYNLGYYDIVLWTKLPP